MIAQTTIRIRELQPTDTTAFDKLVVSTLGDSLGEVLPERELRACAQAYRSRPAGQICYVADAGGTLVGYGTVQRELSGEPSARGRVERLYVCHADLDAAEGGVVAAMLVDTLCSGKPETDSIALTDRATALALYERWGFVDVAAFGLCLSVPSGHGRFMTEALAA